MPVRAAGAEEPDGRRLASAAVRSFLVLFALTLGAAALAYHGGSWADEKATGFSLLRNYWCDLLRRQAVDGAPNALAAALARLAFLTIAGALLPFWWLASGRLRSPRVRRAVLALGVSSAAAVVGVSLLTHDGFRLAHATCTMTAGAAGLGAAALVVAADWRRPCSPASRTWGLALVVTAAWNVAVYLPLVVRGGDSAVMPLAQKIATIALLGWTWTLAGPERAAPPPRP